MTPEGFEVDIVWNGRRARAFVPSLLQDRDLALDARSAARAAAAASEVAFAAEALDPDYEPLARLLLRAEGVASSFIEGVTASVVDVVLAEEGIAHVGASTASWVASNLAAVAEAVTGGQTHADLSVATLCDWHRTLMRGSPTPERYVGVVRDEQGWIGGTSPLDAHLVTPPPGELPALLADLVSFANRTDVDPVAQAAITHAQFEVIHPFGDGNGRVGRALVAWVLTRRLALLVPPPVSVAIAADVGGYTAGLVGFRLGDLRSWVTWFADAVASGGRSQRALVERVDKTTARWRAALASTERQTRSDAAVFAALDLIPRHLVLTSRVLAEQLGITPKSALATLHRLVNVGVLSEHGTLRRTGPGQPAGLFVSRELLGLAGSAPMR